MRNNRDASRGPPCRETENFRNTYLKIWAGIWNCINYFGLSFEYIWGLIFHGTLNKLERKSGSLEGKELETTMSRKIIERTRRLLEETKREEQEGIYTNRNMKSRIETRQILELYHLWELGAKRNEASVWQVE